RSGGARGLRVGRRGLLGGPGAPSCARRLGKRGFGPGGGRGRAREHGPRRAARGARGRGGSHRGGDPRRVLVCRKDRAESVREVVEELRRSGRVELL
ncbi:MAG: hypothetical protein V1918_00945, partial [Planctomycetota bacterium]